MQGTSFFSSHQANFQQVQAIHSTHRLVEHAAREYKVNISHHLFLLCNFHVKNDP